MKKTLLWISVAVIGLGIIGLAAVTAVSSLSPKGAIEQELSKTKKMLRQGFDRNKALVNETAALNEKNISQLQQIDEKNRELDSLRKQLEAEVAKAGESSRGEGDRLARRALQFKVKDHQMRAAASRARIQSLSAQIEKDESHIRGLEEKLKISTADGPISIQDLSDEEVGKLRRQIAKEYLGTIEDLLAYIDQLKAGNETASETALLPEPDEAISELEAVSPQPPPVPDKDLSGLQAELEGERRLRKKDRATFYYNLGVVYSQYNLYPEASEVLEKALVLNPDDAASHYNLAILYDDHLERKDKAISHYEEYLRLVPDTKKRREVENWILEAKRLKPRDGGRGRSALGAFENMFLTNAER